mmetsp:Transcript_26132/g.40198  ORF Transcript_26132/g.40198 Transcript_26132/m.40198 type:complete len:140 (-) Transcript_26132:1536-1955(-)
MALDINSNTLVVLAGGRRLESDILLALRLCKKIAIDDVSLALVVQLQAAATLRGSETETETETKRSRYLRHTPPHEEVQAITAIDSSKRETHLAQTSILLLLLDSAVFDVEFEQSPHTYLNHASWKFRLSNDWVLVLTR